MSLATLPQTDPPWINSLFRINYKKAILNF